MDKKYGSYEETHKKLVEAMQEACTHDEFDDYKAPDIDLTFMNIDSEQAKRKENRINRFNKIAAVVVIALLATNLIAISNKTGQSYGDKGLLHRITETITGVVTDDDKPIEEDELVNEYVAASNEEMPDIIEAFPELYVPNYLPQGFSLDKLTVYFYESGDITAEYIYGGDDKTNLTIGLLYNTDGAEKVYSANIDETFVLEDRKIYLYDDIENDSYVIDVYTEDCTISITGIADKYELVKIAKNMNVSKNAH